MMNEDSGIPWRTLARFTGPLVIWLSLSYLVVYIVMGTAWMRRMLDEETPENLEIMLVCSLACLLIGFCLTLWGFLEKRVDHVKVATPRDRKICPNCRALLYSTSGVCPFCGTQQYQYNAQNDQNRQL
jgi:hypothetical protein